MSESKAVSATNENKSLSDTKDSLSVHNQLTDKSSQSSHSIPNAINAAEKGWPDQDLSNLDISTLTPLSPVVMHRQATINIGTIGHVAHGKLIQSNKHSTSLCNS